VEEIEAKDDANLVTKPKNLKEVRLTKNIFQIVNIVAYQ